MSGLGNPVIDPNLFGPIGRKHIEAAGEWNLNAANTHADYQSVLRPQAGDRVTLSPQALEARPTHPA